MSIPVPILSAEHIARIAEATQSLTVEQKAAIQLDEGIASVVGSWPPAANAYQQGVVSLVAGQQSYAVVFSPVMTGIPKVHFSILMADSSGEVLYGVLQEDALSATGFTVWLNTSPTASTGKLSWTATV